MVEPIIRDIAGSDIKIRFFTRNGGVSTHQYGTLNCGFGSDDIKENVAENRRLVAQNIGLTANQLLSVNQYHSADIIDITNAWQAEEAPKADGMVTNLAQIGLGVLSADCGPVLFADPVNGIIAAVHSGWRGTVAGISANAINKMLSKGAERQNIHAFLGPMIAQASYEVGSDVREQVLGHNPKYADLFIHTEQEDKYLFNLPALIRRQLEATNIGHIDDLSIDTYVNDAEYFSYRRNTHQNIKDYGRGISVIAKVDKI